MKTHALSALLALMLALFPMAASAAGRGPSAILSESAVVVNNPDPSDRLNLRTAPSQDAPSLGKYYNGTFLTAVSDEKDGWVKVRLFDLEGYMMAKFLVHPDQLEIGAATIPAVRIENSGGTGLHLRKAQSTDSRSLGLYPNGSTVRVFGVSETWCHVQTEDGNVGFMLRERLSPVLEYQKGSPTGAGPSQSAKKSATVNNPNSIDRLNLRTMPSEDAPTLGKYYSGTVVEVLGETQNGWTKVRFHTLEGYMMTRYLAFGHDQSQVIPTILSVQIKNPNGTGLNLRRQPSTASPSLGLYPNGSIVTVYGVGETWCHVQTGDGNVGFMLRESLSPTPEFARTKVTGDMLEGSWITEPIDSDAEDFIPGGNG